MSQGDYSGVTLIGTVQPRDAEAKFTQSGTQITSFRFVVSPPGRKDKNGEWADESDWYQVTAFGKLAERVAEMALKGTRLVVIGPLSQRPYETSAGEKRMSMEVKAEMVSLAGRKDRSDTAVASQTSFADEADAPF
jgi:single-strand DNA-binding protein